MLAEEQLGEGTPVFRLASKAPVDRPVTCKGLSGEGILATKLALSSDDRQRLQLTRIEGWKACNFGITVLAELNGLFLPPMQDSREVQGGFVLLTFGTEHRLCS